MKIPVIAGIIRRRFLLNYRIDPSVVQKILPHGFRPKTHKDFAIAGVCLIRLEETRPRGLPKSIGISSENSAHRFAVEWDEPDGPKEGVFVPRRDTDSCFNAFAGGRIFPGVHNRATFQYTAKDNRHHMLIVPQHEEVPLIEFDAAESESLNPASIFDDLACASRFFETGCIGYSARPDSPTLDGLRLKTMRWQVGALRVDLIRSSYFENEFTFPPDSIQFDHGLIMRDIPHEWHAEVAKFTNPDPP